MTVEQFSILPLALSVSPFLRCEMVRRVDWMLNALWSSQVASGSKDHVKVNCQSRELVWIMSSGEGSWKLPATFQGRPYRTPQRSHRLYHLLRFYSCSIESTDCISRHICRHPPSRERLVFQNRPPNLLTSLSPSPPLTGRRPTVSLHLERQLRKSYNELWIMLRIE